MNKTMNSISCLLWLMLSEQLYAETELEKLKAEVDKLKEDVQLAAEWNKPSTLIHMAGYSDINYTDGRHTANGNFSVGSLSPIFHYQYRDYVMLESELAIEIEPDGSTKTTLEYLTIDLFLNDYITFLGGKFLSPIGQFRQNIHPSWINKLPSAPPGFGHDGAAPLTEIGMQIRGAYPLGGMRSNFAVYISNGPELVSEFNEKLEYELDGVSAETPNGDSDNKKAFGFRFALLPTSGLEIGVSMATGKATVTKIEDNSPGSTAITVLPNEQARDYSVIGFDYVWHYNSFILRGEYVNTKIGESTFGITKSDYGEWRSVYTQISYQFLNKLEPVIRHTNFDTTNDAKDQRQWVIGLNYLLTSSVIAKVAYEFNEGANETVQDHDRILVQLAYGF